MLTAAPCARRFARLPEGPVALLQVGDLRDAGIAAALRLPPRAAPCDARTGEPPASQFEGLGFRAQGRSLGLLATLNIVIGIGCDRDACTGEPPASQF